MGLLVPVTISRHRLQIMVGLGTGLRIRDTLKDVCAVSEGVSYGWIIGSVYSAERQGPRVLP